MKTKQKAINLVGKFLDINLVQFNRMVNGQRLALAKQCAIIYVEGIQETLDDLHNNGIICNGSDYYEWDEVIKEIEKL